MTTGFTATDVAAPLKSILEMMQMLQPKNCAPIPVSIVHEESQWAVYLEVRCSRDRRFDIRTADKALPEALRKALTQLRRNL